MERGKQSLLPDGGVQSQTQYRFIKATNQSWGTTRIAHIDCSCQAFPLVTGRTLLEFNFVRTR
eukprot:3329409-Amphidinium_carterae.1